MIWYFIGGLIGVGGVLFIGALIGAFTENELSGKKVMMFGPPRSGKTTFKNWLMYRKPQPKGSYYQTGATEDKPEEHDHYHDEDNDIDYDILDRGGSWEFLVGTGQSLYETHDIILMFFNVKKYICDNQYKTETNNYFEFLATLHKENEKPILIIGSYKDELSKQQQKSSSNLVNLIDTSKEYFPFLSRQSYVLANMFNKRDIFQILKEMKEIIEK